MPCGPYCGSANQWAWGRAAMSHRMSRTMGWVALAAALLLAGCGGLVTTTRHAPGYTGAMVQGFLASAASEGPVLVRVANNPFGGPIDRLVAEEATKASRLHWVKFTANPAEAKSGDWRVV